MFCLIPSCVQRSTASAKACLGQLEGTNNYLHKSLKYSQRSLIRLKLFTGNGEVKIIDKKTDSLLRLPGKHVKVARLTRIFDLTLAPLPQGFQLEPESG